MSIFVIDFKKSENFIIKTKDTSMREDYFLESLLMDYNRKFLSPKKYFNLVLLAVFKTSSLSNIMTIKAYNPRVSCSFVEVALVHENQKAFDEHSWYYLYLT